MRTNVAPSPEIREARARETLQQAEVEMLLHALRRLTAAQDAVVRMQGVTRGTTTGVPTLTSAEARRDGAAQDAALWRAIVEGRLPGA